MQRAYASQSAVVVVVDDSRTPLPSTDRWTTRGSHDQNTAARPRPLLQMLKTIMMLILLELSDLGSHCSGDGLEEMELRPGTRLRCTARHVSDAHPQRGCHSLQDGT